LEKGRKRADVNQRAGPFTGEKSISPPRGGPPGWVFPTGRRQRKGPKKKGRLEIRIKERTGPRRAENQRLPQVGRERDEHRGGMNPGSRSQYIRSRAKGGKEVHQLRSPQIKKKDATIEFLKKSTKQEKKTKQRIKYIQHYL